MKAALAVPKLDPVRPETLCCSMCGRPSGEVRYLMAGAAGGFICDACTVAAMKIVVRTRLAEAVGRTAQR